MSELLPHTPPERVPPRRRPCGGRVPGPACRALRPGELAREFGGLRPHHAPGSRPGRYGGTPAGAVPQPPADVASVARPPRGGTAWAAAMGAPRCPFALAPGTPCTCVADALARRELVLVRDGTGLVHFTVPLVLDDHPVGALLAGQVFDQYPEQLVLEHMATRLGVSSARALAGGAPGGAGQTGHRARLWPPAGCPRPGVPAHAVSHTAGRTALGGSRTPLPGAHGRPAPRNRRAPAPGTRGATGRSTLPCWAGLPPGCPMKSAIRSRRSCCTSSC